MQVPEFTEMVELVRLMELHARGVNAVMTFLQSPVLLPRSSPFVDIDRYEPNP